MDKTVRTFIAIELPAHVAQLAEQLQARLKEHALKLRWVRPRNIHLTLKFLGEVPEDDIEKIAAAMQDAAHGRGALDLVVQGLGVFPGIRKPRVMWVGLGGAVDLLGHLQVRLEEILEPLGFARERRPFRAHLTLGRFKGRVDARRLQQAIQEVGQFAPTAFQALEVVLFKSDLRPQGALYTSLARQVLDGPVDPDSGLQ